MKNQKLKILLLFIVFLFPFLIPFSTKAGLLPCGPFTSKPYCEPCDLLVLFVNVVEFLLFRLIPILAAVVLGYGGFVFLIGLLQESSETVNKGKKWLLSVLIGLVIIYGAWLLVDLFFRLMGFTQERWPGLANAWWRIQINCETRQEPLTFPGPGTTTEQLGNQLAPGGAKELEPPPEENKEEKCVKIAGNNDQRRLVLIPFNGKIVWSQEEFGFKLEFQCKSEKWTEDDIKKGNWEKIANKFSGSLKMDPFLPENFSIYRYDDIVTQPDDSPPPCSGFRKIFIFNCISPSIHRGLARDGGDVFLFLDSTENYLLHELGHSIGELQDEYEEFDFVQEYYLEMFKTRYGIDIEKVEIPSNLQRNCAHKQCPSWWKDYGANCIEGCWGLSKYFFRDHQNDIMRDPSSGTSFGPIDKYYLYKALGFDTESLKIKEK